MIHGFLASGVFIKDSFISWDDQPTITTLDSIAAPIEDIQFPTVTVCNEEYKKPDDWTLLEIILNAVAFECKDEHIEGIIFPGYKELPLCSTTKEIRKDFFFMLKQTLKEFFSSVASSKNIPLAKMVVSQMNAEHVKESWTDLVKTFNEGKINVGDVRKWIVELFGYQFKTVDQLIEKKLNKTVPEYEYTTWNLFDDTSSNSYEPDEESLCGNTSDCLYFKRLADDPMQTLSHTTGIYPKLSFGSFVANNLVRWQRDITDSNQHISEEYAFINRFFANLSQSQGFKMNETVSMPEIPAMFALQEETYKEPNYLLLLDPEDEAFTIDWKTTYTRTKHHKGIDSDVNFCRRIWSSFLKDETGT